MTIKFGKLMIDNSNYMHYDNAMVEPGSRELVFASIVAGDALIKNIQKRIKRKANCYIEGKTHCSVNGKYYSKKDKRSGDDFSHLVIKKEDVVDTTSHSNDEEYTWYVFYKSDKELEEVFFDKLYKDTSIPLIKDWTPFILEKLMNIRSVKNMVNYHGYEDQPFKCAKINTFKSHLLNIIQDGLRKKDITIEGKDNVSQTMNEVNGLDMYLNVFGDTLAEKIQTAFTPKFDPHKDSYSEYVNNYDDSCHYAGIDLYEAQKAVIESSVRNLNKNNVTFVIGEMGCGNFMYA